MTNTEQMQSWDVAGKAFNEIREERVNAVEYGPFCPNEDSLRLLGIVDRLAVLDAGCGGGQNSVCLAEHGAKVTALDISRTQVEIATQRARRAGVNIRAAQGNVIRLRDIADGSQRLVLCTNVFTYVEKIEQALAACRRVLAESGRLVISMDHPIRSCFVDTETSDLSNYPERSYYSHKPRRWLFDGTNEQMTSYDRTVGEWIDLLHAAGFRLQRLLEAPAREDMLDEYFPKDGPFAGLRNIPHTLILVARAENQR